MNRFVAFFVVSCSIAHAQQPNWSSEKHEAHTLYYTSSDTKTKAQYVQFIENGISSVTEFFGGPFVNTFEVHIHPNRASLDRQWQKDWQMPDFKSECWMVASGVGTKLDMISPALWNTEACEHKYEDKLKTQQLITHELFHVYHGQHNPSPDFSEVQNIDWFVEGLATYASGQMDETRTAEVKAALAENQIPKSIDQFWTGKLRYGLSGSLVKFIDQTFGRELLRELLRVQRKQDLLSALNLTEEQLLNNWKAFMNN